MLKKTDIIDLLGPSEYRFTETGKTELMLTLIIYLLSGILVGYMYTRISVIETIQRRSLHQHNYNYTGCSVRYTRACSFFYIHLFYSFIFFPA